MLFTRTEKRAAWVSPPPVWGGASYEMSGVPGLFRSQKLASQSICWRFAKPKREKERHETFGYFKRVSALYRFICACGIGPEQ